MPSADKDTTPGRDGTTRYRAYWHAAPLYHSAGWSPIPLRSNKAPLVEGVTGREGRYLAASDLGAFCTRFPMANVGLRLPKGVVGLDVDAYDDKAGRSTLAVLIRRYGPLPDTWVSTSKTDGLSGIYLYRLPPEYADAELHDPGGGIEVVQWFHRTAVVMPSIHESEARYYWYRMEAGRLIREGVWLPSPEDLALLPVEWVRGLLSRRGGAGASRTRVDVGSSVSDALTQVSDPSDALCPGIRATLSRWRSRVQAAGRNGGAYDASRDGVHALLGDAWLGHVGAYRALQAFGITYMKSTRDRKRDRAEEFRRHVLGELSARHATAPRAADPCDEEKL